MYAGLMFFLCFPYKKHFMFFKAQKVCRKKIEQIKKDKKKKRKLFKNALLLMQKMQNKIMSIFYFGQILFLTILFSAFLFSPYCYTIGIYF